MVAIEQTVKVRLPPNTPLVIDLNVEAAPGTKGGWGTSKLISWNSTYSRSEWHTLAN